MPRTVLDDKRDAKESINMLSGCGLAGLAGFGVVSIAIIPIADPGDLAIVIAVLDSTIFLLGSQMFATVVLDMVDWLIIVDGPSPGPGDSVGSLGIVSPSGRTPPSRTGIPADSGPRVTMNLSKDQMAVLKRMALAFPFDEANDAWLTLIAEYRALCDVVSRILDARKSTSYHAIRGELVGTLRTRVQACNFASRRIALFLMQFREFVGSGYPDFRFSYDEIYSHLADFSAGRWAPGEEYVFQSFKLLGEDRARVLREARWLNSQVSTSRRHGSMTLREALSETSSLFEQFDALRALPPSLAAELRLHE